MSFGQMALERLRVDAGLLQLRGCPRRRRQALNPVTLAFGRVPHFAQRRGLAGARDPLETEHAVAVGKDLIDGFLLTGIQVAFAGRLLADPFACKRSTLIAALPYELDVVALGRDHRWRRVS